MQVNNINPIDFQARIQVEKLQKYAYIANEIQRTAPPSSQVSTGSNYLASCVSTIAGVSAGKTTAASSGAIGTAFSADACGINMSNIVPSVIAKIPASTPPEVLATSVEHPEVAGGFFSTAGVWFNKHFKISLNHKETRKIPS